MALAGDRGAYGAINLLAGLVILAIVGDFPSAPASLFPLETAVSMG